MASKCDECGRELNFRDVRVLRGRNYCDACLAKIDAGHVPDGTSFPVATLTVPGANVSLGLKVFAYLSMVGGLVGIIASGAGGGKAVIMIVAGLFWGVMLLGFSTIIDLLRSIYTEVKK